MGYVRPDVVSQVFRDAEGRVIDYGSRWEGLDQPPEDSYSVVSHPERFAPLALVADALLDFLVETYDVTLEEGYQATEGMPFRPEPEDVVRAVKLRPSRATATPATFVISTFPGVSLAVGALSQASFPTCACDACDETWQWDADELEWRVMAVVAGGLKEDIGGPLGPAPVPPATRAPGTDRTYGTELELPGAGTRSGRSIVRIFTPDAVDHAEEVLRDLATVTPDGRWQPWPRRT